MTEGYNIFGIPSCGMVVYCKILHVNEIPTQKWTSENLILLDIQYRLIVKCKIDP